MYRHIHSLVAFTLQMYALLHDTGKQSFKTRKAYMQHYTHSYSVAHTMNTATVLSCFVRGTVHWLLHSTLLMILLCNNVSVFVIDVHIEQ
jgi:hypothetical protein